MAKTLHEAIAEIAGDTLDPMDAAILLGTWDPMSGPPVESGPPPGESFYWDHRYAGKNHRDAVRAAAAEMRAAVRDG